MKKEAYLILHNIRSAYNVGSIFRTADAAGVSKIFLTGYTPTPIDRFGRTQSQISKTALGSEKSMRCEYMRNPKHLLKRLKKEGVYCIAVEQDERSIDYKKIEPRFPVAFLFGNEVRGVSQTLLSESDAVTFIPMKGKKESLNVSTAVGVALFRVLSI